MRSKIKPYMFVSCNESKAWNGYVVKEGHVGMVVDRDYKFVYVKWMTLKAGDPAYSLLNQQSYGGPWESLDLLISPVGFSC